MKINERLEKLRELMAEKGIDAYIIPTSDPHLSEYLSDHWKARVWISGFTGSAGTVVVTADESGLWTDGRYFIQAEDQLKGSEIKLFKMRMPKVPTVIEWLRDNLEKGSTVGFNGEVVPHTLIKNMEKEFSKKEIKLEENYDLIGKIWSDRPEKPKSKIFIHDTKYAGKTPKEKLEDVREEMRKYDIDYFLLGSLDDIAWLYNIRGRDVKNNPVVTSYALVSMDKSWLFVDKYKVDGEVEKFLKENGIEIKEYKEVRNFIENISKDSTIYIDPDKINRWLYNGIPKECKIVEGMNFTTKLKAIKNDVEIENLKKCYIKDGVALVKFLYWLDKNVDKNEITEMSAEEKLESFRKEQELFVEPSFDTIAAYKEHGAMMHYKATEESNYTLKPEGMFLVDSGGQYYDGTTDTTRTIILGPITDEEKRDFTLTLKGLINLSKARFLHGATFSNLDVLARLPLWEIGIDYKCGTGHGIGFFLNVHEGPNNFSQRPTKVVVEEGMVTSIEPGVYKAGKYGIRLENVVVAVKDYENESGQFMKFETLTNCPLDLEGIDVKLLSEEEIKWLNEYHKQVYDNLSPYLSEEEKEWLKEETKEI